jgi:hypothetical protein
MDTVSLLAADSEAERGRERLTYRLCGVGFGFLAFGLAVACLETFLFLPHQFGGPPFLPWLTQTSWWKWHDLPYTWGCLVGTYFLWGRWNDPSWQRRTGLLLVMTLVDVTLWFLDHGGDLGLRLQDVGHQWFRARLGEALGWAEFALLASLSCDVIVHLGVEQAAETGRATRSLAGTGAAVWMALFLIRTDWHRGWPLFPRRNLWFEALLLDLGQSMIWTVTLIQVTALTVAAAKQCAAVLAEMEREDQQLDVFKSPSEEVFGAVSGAAGSGGEE